MSLIAILKSIDQISIELLAEKLYIEKDILNKQISDINNDEKQYYKIEYVGNKLQIKTKEGIDQISNVGGKLIVPRKKKLCRNYTSSSESNAVALYKLHQQQINLVHIPDVTIITTMQEKPISNII